MQGDPCQEANRLLAGCVAQIQGNKIALVAAIILIVLIFFILFGPAISGYEFEEIDSNAINQGPSAAHWFGTDNLG